MSLAAEAGFGLSLLREASVNQTTVLSPISVALALSLVHLGAKGSSKEQIKNAICKAASHETCISHFSSLQKSLSMKDDPYLTNWKYCNKPGNISCVPEYQRQFFKPEDVPPDYPIHYTGVLMNIANRLFVSNEIKVKKPYQSGLIAKFDAIIQNIDYSDPEKAAEIVNDFVKSETAGKIEKLVSSDSFENDRVAILVNAVYFHGKWVEPFQEYYNKEDKFYMKDDVSKNVTFMQETGLQYRMVTTENFVSLDLPFRNYTYKFSISLPKKRFGLAEALRKLTGEELTKIVTNDVLVENVDILIPKFKIETEIQLQEVLKRLGMTDLFTSNADLTGITDTPTRLGKVMHKVMIDVNEKGATAAAATGIEYVNEGRMIYYEPPTKFVADHPFLFILSQEGHVLFIGHYYG